MLIRPWLRGVAIVGSIVLGAAPAQSQSSVHSVYATVLNRGTPVEGLTAADFVVREDGATRRVVSSEAATNPIDIAVVVSMADGNITDVRQGIVDFFHAIDAVHQIALTGLERPSVTIAYTDDESTVVRGVKALYPHQGRGAYASVYDTVLAASRTLQARPATTRRVIVVVSDGSFSGTGLDKQNELQRALGDSEAALYFVTVARSQPPYEYPGGSYYIKPPVSVAETLPNISGGRVTYVLASSGVPAALAEIAGQLNHQYRVGYLRPAGEMPGSLLVSVSRPEMTARARGLPPR